jgi:hypothetical protein
MSKRLEQFANDLHQEVLTKTGDDASPQLREDSFTEYLLELLSEHNEADGWEVCYHNARSAGRLPAAKLNAWSLSGDGATLDLFVVLFHDTDTITEVSKLEAKKQIQLPRGFLRRALNGVHAEMEESSDAFRAAQQIYEARETLATVRLFLLTDGVVRSLEKMEVDQLDKPFNDIKIQYVVWDLEKFSRLRVGDREVIELDFAKDYDGAISCLQTVAATGEYQTFLAYLPGPLLARIYGEHGQRLLERNVRAFLQAKGKVNKGLQKTIKEDPHRFLAYNNGLCCTAAEVRTVFGKDGHTQLAWVKDFQIVNGGQTTASIFHAMRKEKIDVRQVVVQIKLTVLKNPADVPEIVPLISRYANSQNTVKNTDIAANGPFHQELEKQSRMNFTPPIGGLDKGSHWYYERARGSYLDDKERQGTAPRKRAWEQQNPKDKKFSKADIAKFEHAWLGKPQLVCLGAEKNFTKFAERLDEEGDPLVDLNYFQQLVAKAIFFRTAEKVFSALDLEGYRANSVAYSVAWLAERSGRRIDLERIWKEQHLPPGLVKALETVCAAAHTHITEGDGNPGEISKRDACWNSFRDCELQLPPLWEREWAHHAFVTPTNERDALASEWEKVRSSFLDDNRTIQELETYTCSSWMSKYRGESVSALASLEWEDLRKKPGLGLKKLRGLVEMLTIAAKDKTPNR